MSTNQQNAASYNTMADDYHNHLQKPETSPYHAYYEKPAIRSVLPDLSGLEVISIGCGSGVDARWMKDSGADKVVGIDISEKLIEIAKKENPDIDFRVMDMENIDFPDESFDLAHSSLAIHYVDDWSGTLSNIYRVLKKNGTFIFSCAHPIDSALIYEENGDEKFAFIGKKKNLITKEKFLYGDYMRKNREGSNVVNSEIGKIPVTVYGKTFSVMANNLIDAGFKINKVVEPLPTEKLEEVDPIEYEQLSRIPAFIIWVLEK